MKKITKTVVNAFLKGESKSVDNTMTDGKQLWLFGNVIAKITDRNCLYITNADYPTKTTYERLNAIPGVSIYVKNEISYLNGKEWDGNWTLIERK